MLRLQPYQVTVAYRKGEENPANYISRHPARQTPTTSRQERVTEKFVDYIACTSTPKVLKLQDIESAMERDPTLQAITKELQTGNWFEAAKRPDINKPAYQVMERVKGELTFCTTFNIVLRGTRIVITEELQQCVVDLAHKGHQGIVKKKALLREKGWFTGIKTQQRRK